MDHLSIFKNELDKVSSGQGTFQEFTEQGKRLMETCKLLPDESKMVCLKEYLDVILRESFNIVAARQYCNEFNNTIVHLSPHLQKQLIPYALEKIQNRTISFEAQIYTLRTRLADELEKDQEWVQAAKVLSQVPLDGGQTQYNAETKRNIYMKVGRLYLEAEEFTEAEAFIQRVGMLMDGTVEEDSPLRLSHSAAFARIQDFRRKYVEAAQRYYDLSRRSTVIESERKVALQSAVNCILLAPVSPQRVRVMALLVKDDRSLELPTYGFLRKVFDGKTLNRGEVEQFALNLLPHQRNALTPDGTKLLERTVLEHNILSSKKYFRVASFEALSRLLDIPADKLERIVVNMVAEGRLRVKINHITNSVTFDDEHPMNAWDKKLEQICTQVGRAVEMIGARHAEWYEKTVGAA